MDFGRSAFLKFNELTNLISITEGVTSNSDQGVYEIKILLTDVELETTKSYQIRIMLIAADEPAKEQYEILDTVTALQDSQLEASYKI